MATLANVLTFARAMAQTDSNGLTDTNGIVFANEAKIDFHRRLVSRSIDASAVQEAYRDATASQGTYLYPDDLLFLKAIELNYQNTSADSYVRANQMDVSNIPGETSFSQLRSNASTASPYFDDRGDWYEIFPTPIAGNNLTALIRIFYFPMPTEYTATTDTISYPETLDYRILGWRIASDYYYSLNKITEGDAFNLKYEERINDLVSTLGRGAQQPIQVVPIQLDGWNF